ncbi:hypothetical protein LR013_03435 [candidate division NPL-UPA2 bacterium]|nr:hypothetical protein [candidate division NPL-UPA2 bacterium]
MSVSIFWIILSLFYLILAIQCFKFVRKANQIKGMVKLAENGVELDLGETFWRVAITDIAGFLLAGGAAILTFLSF